MSHPCVVLGVLVLARTAYGMQYPSLGAVGPAVMGSLDLSFAALGTLIGAYSALGLFVALPGGWMIGRFGDRRILLLGIGLMMAGGVMLVSAPSFEVALLARLLSGGGSVLVVVVAPKMVMDRFPAPQLPAAMGALIVGYPLGNALALGLLPMMGSWRPAMGLVAGLCALALVAAAFVVRKVDGGPAAVVGRTPWPGRRPLLALLAIAGVWALLNCGFAAFLGFAPAFFVAQGMPPATAGLLLSLAPLIIVPFAPAAGWLVGYVGHPLKIVAASLVMSVAALLALVSEWPAVPALFLLGAVTGVMSGPIMALPNEVLAPQQRALGMGIFYAVFYGSLTALPPLAGYAADATGSVAAPLFVAAGLYGFGVLALIGFVVLRPGKPTVVG